MKVVLIAESEETIKEYSEFLEDAGADVITYRWFLKALDNLTEIQPHIIIVSALDFPRHWKTLFTHIEAGAIKTQPLVYLITDPSFTDSEKKKAMFLGAQDIFQTPLTNRDRNSLLSMLPAGMGIEMPAAPVKREPLPEDEPAADLSASESVAEEAADVPETQEEKPLSEYEALQQEASEEAVSQNKIHNIAAAEANAFELIDSEISNITLDAGDDEEIEEVSEDGISAPEESLVIEGADEDILSKLEDEMTESDPDSVVAAAEAAAAKLEAQEAAATANSAPEPETEPVPEPAPAEPEAERPEQVTWSAPIDEIDDSTQFSFINPRSGLVVTGTVQDYNHPTIKFIPSSADAVDGIRFGQILEQCKFTFEGETIKARAQVRGLGKAIEFCLLY